MVERAVDLRQAGAGFSALTEGRTARGGIERDRSWRV
jgi:hypothetical protein